MADLIAQGPERRDRWRRRLFGSEQPLRLGRDCGRWSVPWDAWISREHAELRWNGHHLIVHCLPTATNPIFFQGAEASQFHVGVGEHFVIGQTQFSLVDARAQVSLVAPVPTSQQTFSADSLRKAGFHRAQQQIQALTRLPELIAGANSNLELSVRVVNLVLTGVSTAHAAALVAGQLADQPDERMEVLHWDAVGEDAGDFQPSASLIREALVRGASVVHYWTSTGSTQAGTVSPAGVCHWAFCSPIPGDACRGQALYVAGKATEGIAEIELEDALKFVELVGTTVAHVCDLRALQERSSALAQFFSPPVREVVAAADLEVVLAPRRTEVSVLFCDLRGFSRQSEQAADDLLGLLQRVSEALGIMTRQILDTGGVVGDFHGDAAMGFWGWPLADEDRVVHACQAALAIRAAFREAAEQHRHALIGFRVGMGLATGEAVAGKLGTVDQVKVTAFGPVVNLASRLEGLTRSFGVAILVDAATAAAAKSCLPPRLGRLRYVARLQPYGMSAIEDVYELMPGGREETDNAAANDEQLATALQAFREGAWPSARARFERLAPHDPLRNFYLRYLDRHADRPPSNWDGVVRFNEKP